ncbi:MAG: hypothetical protein HEP71_04415 [Roseivirga sp.]|nr:hypothetical protein [Roseivirga sp.]
MKNLLLLSLLAISAFTVNAQNVHLEGGVAMGGVPNAGNGRGKAMLYAAGYKTLSDRFTFGLELSTGGDFIPGDNATFEGTTEILDPNDTNWSSVMAKGRYYFTSGSSPLYAGTGVGINSYWEYVHTLESKTASKINLAFAPEIGIDIRKRLNVSLRYLVGGSTDSFEGIKPQNTSGDRVSLESQRVSIILFSMGLRLNL